jgi:hypothetical protein
LQRLEELERAQEFVDDRGLPTGQDDALYAAQLPLALDRHGLRPGGLHGVNMFSDVAL